MIPYTTLDSIIAQMPERTGHTLLDEDQGCVKGCRTVSYTHLTLPTTPYV